MSPTNEAANRPWLRGPSCTLGWLGLVALSGCVSLRAPVPMTSRLDALEAGSARCLIVLLPGLGDDARTFQDEGFVRLVRRQNLSADVVATDAIFGYYASGTFVARLDEDVITPARRKGYSRIWLIGASMGGFGSLFYPSQRPGQIDGVLALAPWLGDASLLEQIRQAGGLARWEPPPAAESTADNFQPQLWRWLKETKVEGKPGPVTWLGWGSEDRLGSADALLAAALPPERVLSTPGGHQWAAWRRMMKEFLERSDLARDCAR